MPDEDNPFERLAKLLPEELGLTRLVESPHAVWFILLLGLVAIATSLLGMFER